MAGYGWRGILAAGTLAGLIAGGCSPQYGNISPGLATGPNGMVIVPPPPITPVPTPTSGPSSVVIFSGQVNATLSVTTPPNTQIATFSPSVTGKQVTVTVTAQLATSLVGVQLNQAGTTTVLASNLTPTSSSTVVTFTPSTLDTIAVLANDVVNGGTNQNFTVQVVQQLQ